MNLLPAKICTACGATFLIANFRTVCFLTLKYFSIFSLMLILSSPAAFAGGKSNNKPVLTKTVAAPSPQAQKVKEMLTYGAARHREGNFLEAESVFRAVLHLEPTNEDAFYNLGAIAERRGDYINALSNYRAALNLKPDDKQVLEAIKAVEALLCVQESFPLRMPVGNYSGVNQNNSANGFPNFPAPVPAVSNSSFPLNLETGAPYQDAQQPSYQLPAGVGNFTLPVAEQESQPPTLPLANLSDPPPKLNTDTGAYQLSSSQAALKTAKPSVLSVTPQSTPVPTVPVAPVSRVNNQANSRSRAVVRSVVNSALNVGTSYALRSTGLHCPLCHVLRFRF
jgi:hypothetical protein